MKRRIPLLALAAFLAVGCAPAAQAPAAPAPDGASEAASGAPAGAAERWSPSAFKPLAEVTKDAVHREGFFESWQKGDDLFLAVPKDRLGDDFLMVYKIARGIGARGLIGGTMLDIFEGAVVAFERHGDKVFLVQRPHRHRAPADSPLEEAVSVAFGSSVLESGDIQAIRGDSALVVNVGGWLVSDLSGVSQRVRGAVSQPGRPGNVTFDRGRSHLESVKSFPKNMNVQARLTFRPSEPVSLPSLPDGRYIPISIHYTFAELPEVPMTPRLADDRVGYFMTVHKDFSRDDDEFFVRHVNRWRLEPGEPAGNGLVYPVKPIVYYLDRSIPEEYRPWMKEGVEAWNSAFEQAGFKDAVRAEMLPEDADPEDIRYPTLRWSTSDQPSYGAIGPSIVDPRTGEIIASDQLYEANMVRGFKRAWRTEVSPVAALEQALNATEEELEMLARGGEMEMLGAELGAQGALLRATLAGRGEIGPRDEVPAEYVGQALRWVTMHEVGHTLGLRHNFRSSTDTPHERLHDPRWAEERGIYSSVMEYPSINIAPQGTEPGYFYNPGVGSYDRWAIAYGYTPDDDRAAEIARRAADSGHAYGTDEDARGPGALDPHVAVYHLSSDPLIWGAERIEMIEGLWPTLADHVLADNTRYADLTDAFRTLLMQYSRTLSVAVRYVGGQHQYRDRVGDPGSRGPFAAIPRSKQIEALDFLDRYAFGQQAFVVPSELLGSLGADRWSHWGQQNNLRGRIDFPFHEEVLGVQASLLAQLTQPLVFARIRDAEMKFGPEGTLPIPEMLTRITRSVWGEVWTGPQNVNAQRRDLQRAYLDRMTEIVTEPSDRMPADARAVTRDRLSDLDGRLRRALAGGGRLDDYTRAHLNESRARIGKALEAGLEVERQG